MYLNLYVHTSYECKKAGVYDFKTLDFRVAYIISKVLFGLFILRYIWRDTKSRFFASNQLAPPLCECSQGTLIVISTLLSISLLRGFLVNTDSLLGKHLNYTWQAKFAPLLILPLIFSPFLQWSKSPKSISFGVCLPKSPRRIVKNGMNERSTA